MSSFEKGNKWVQGASKVHARKSSHEKVSKMGKSAPDMMGNRGLETGGRIPKLAVKNAAGGAK